MKLSIKKILVVFLLCFTIAPIIAYAGSGDTGYNGAGNGTGYSSGACGPVRGKYALCTSGGTYLVLKMQAVYVRYNSAKGKWNYKTYGRPLYIRKAKSDEWPINCDDGQCLTKPKWFEKKGFDRDAIVKATIGNESGVSPAVAWQKLKPWLKRMNISGETLTNLRNLNSCPIGNRDGTCYKKNGLRLILEPVVTGYNDEGKKKFWTIKQYAKEAGSKDNMGQKVSAAKLYGQSMYTQFNDVGVKHAKSGKGLQKTINCLKKNYNSFNGTISENMCGYGMHIIDLTGVQTKEKYECELNDNGSCRIVDANNGTTKVANISCTDSNGNPIKSYSYKSGNNTITYSFEECPKVSYSCEATETYGVCNIIRDNDQKIVTPNGISCNNGNDGLKVWNGNTLERPCPYTPKYKYDIDIACSNCDTTTKGNRSYYLQDTKQWEAILHSKERNDNTKIQNYFKSDVYENVVNSEENIDNDNDSSDGSDSGTSDSDGSDDDETEYSDNTYDEGEVYDNDEDVDEEADEADAPDDENVIPQNSKINPTEVFCRNEFEVVFPKVKDIFIEAGRYITVNKKGDSLVGGIYNFAPIKVTRIRECIGNNEAILKAYADKHEMDNLGKIKLKYFDGKEEKNSKYTLEQELITKDLSAITKNNKKTIDSNSITTTQTVFGVGYKKRTDKVTAYFELNKNIYRYIAAAKININGQPYEAGESIKKLPSNISEEDKIHLRDLGEASLPISVNNKTGATIGLIYKLPTLAESDSGLAEFAGTYGNRYNQLSDGATIEYSIPNGQRACNMLFDDTTSCEKAESKNHCLAKLQNDNYNDYVCKFKPLGGSDDNEARIGCKPSTCAILKPSKNGEEEKYMCPEKDSNGEKTGSSVLCTKAEYLANCSKNIPRCVIDGDKYYGQNGLQVSKDEYAAECGTTVEKCDVNCEAGFCCSGTSHTCPIKDEDTNNWICPVLDNCNDCDLEAMEEKYGKESDPNYDGKRVSCKEAGFCCPDSEMGCPACYLDENGECEWKCPPSGNKEIIYRTIDLNNPFPGQQGSGRQTGSNWCAKNISTGKYSCNNENDEASLKDSSTDNLSGNNYQTINTDKDNIIVGYKIKNNRGVTRNEVYNKEPMYVFKLTPSKIKDIRNYNKGKAYDDGTALIYNKDNDTFVSSFFKDVGTSQYKTIDVASGTCSTATVLERDGYGNITCQKIGSGE